MSDCHDVTRISVQIANRKSLESTLSQSHTLLRGWLTRIHDFADTANDSAAIAPTFDGCSPVRVASIRRLDESRVYVDFAVRSTDEGVGGTVFTVPVQDRAGRERKLHRIVTCARQTLCRELNHICDRLNGRPAMLHEPEVDELGFGHGI